MKKSLFALFAILFFIGCSKDDNPDIRVNFPADELKSIDGINAYYYIQRDAGNKNIIRFAFIFPFIQDLENLGYAYDAICPNTQRDHNNEIFMIPELGGKIHCTQCNADFDNLTGDASNEVAKGLKIYRYNVSYDKSSKMYRVWK